MSDQKTGSRSQRQIEDNLRRVYDETLAEEVPDRFKDLLARLKSQGAGSKDTGSGAASTGAKNTDRSD